MSNQQQLREAFESAVAQYTDRKYVVPAWQASPFGFEMFCLGVKYAQDKIATETEVH